MKASVSRLLLTSPLAGAPLELASEVVAILGQILNLVESFRAQGATPQATHDDETELMTLLRQLGQQIVAWTYNPLEADEEMPAPLVFEGEYYRRRPEKRQRRGSVWTLFGPITLRRYLYRHWYDLEPSVFPLEINLGLEPGGATPALAMHVAWLSADATALKAKQGLCGADKDFTDAYRYLRNRLGHLDYVDYRRRGLPIGSGVTEAACKIVFTQRFKQSGMAWSQQGGQTILELRLLRLSNVWDDARNAWLRSKPTLVFTIPVSFSLELGASLHLGLGSYRRHGIGRLARGKAMAQSKAEQGERIEGN